MKRFGVHIAAGAVTILLGALAAAQVQKDPEVESNSVWSDVESMPSLKEAPQPIRDLDRESTIADSEGRSQREPDGDIDGGEPASPATNSIRLVQHTEAESPAMESTGRSPTFSMTAPSLGMPAPAVDEDSAADVEPHVEIIGSGLASQDEQVEAGTDGGGLPQRIEQRHKAPGEPSRATDAAQPTLAMQFPSPSQGMPNAENGRGFSGAAAIKPSSASDRDHASTQENASGTAAAETPSGMPEIQFDQPPAMSFLGEATITDAENAPGSQPAEPATRPELAEQDAGEMTRPSIETLAAQPGNILRGGAVTEAAHGASGKLETEAQPSITAMASQPQPQNLDPNAVAQPQIRSGSNSGFAEPDATSGPRSGSIVDTDSAPRMASLPRSLSRDTASQPAADSPVMSNNGPGNLPATQATPSTAYGVAGQTGGYATAASPSQAPAAPPAAMAAGDDGAPGTVAAPGDRRLEGVQTPSVVIQKRAPAKVKVGQETSFVIQIQNVGSAEAIDVQVFDRVPSGMRFVDATPRPSQMGQRGELYWQLGALPAGAERTVTMQLVPEQEGELGSVARVAFEAAASVRTISTRPELKIVQQAPPQVLIGQQLEIELQVSNPGTGEAIGVVLQEDVPEGLEHPKGRQLDNLLGTLRPGESRREVLRLRAVQPGVIENTVRLISDDGLTAQDTVQVEVISPELQIQLNGPKRRYLERQATYEIQVANSGTAEATNVELTAFLDRGFTFVSTENQGQYDPARHAVFWSLARLPEGAGDTVPLTLLPIEEGDQAIRLEATADLDVTAEDEQTVAVDSLAELTFQIADSADPIEMGSESTYEIRINNTGSRDDSNVRAALHLPPGLELVSSDADAGHDGNGMIQFEPKAQLPAGGEIVYRVKVRGSQAGRHVAKVVVVSDQSNVPVTKEESTMVYSDR